MNQTVFKKETEKGMVTVIALMILVVLTLLGIMATRNATTDIRVAANEVSYKRSFYIAEAGMSREALEVGRGNYPVMNINTPTTLASVTNGTPSGSLPGDSHVFGGVTYDFTLRYLGYFFPPTGYSIIHFSRYDYRIDAKIPTDNVQVAGRYYKIGPKASH